MERNKIIKVWALVNLLGYIGTVVVNTLANTIPIGGVSTGEVSDRLANLFTPIGWTFSIWGLIYLWLGVFVLFSLRVAFGQTGERGDFLTGIGPWFAISSLGNMAWIVAWHNQRIGLALILIVVMLGSLIMISLRLGLRYQVPGVRRRLRLLVHAPFSIYLGWLTVATVANVTAWLVSLDVRLPLPELFWTVLVVTVALAINLVALRRNQDVYFGAVGAWAILGIGAARWSEGSAPLAFVALMGLYVLVLLKEILSRRRAFRGQIR